MLILLRRMWSWSKLYEREDMFIWKKLVTLWLIELNVLLKSSSSKYWEEFSKSYSVTASLSLSIMTFSMELLFLVKALNLIVLPWIVEWKSLSFSAEKGYNFFDQVKQYHTYFGWGHDSTFGRKFISYFHGQYNYFNFLSFRTDNMIWTSFQMYYRDLIQNKVTRFNIMFLGYDVHAVQ